MFITYADSGKGEGYPQCPLRTDLHSCGVNKNSQINDCPQLDDDGVYYTLPEYCPLKKGDVIVRFR